MATCPNKRKTSDLAAGNGQQSSLAGLAKQQGCTQRTVREWCKEGLIKEAYQTLGGHWRIRKPLSWKTRYELEKRSDDWPFRGMNVIKTGKDFMRVFEPERAESLMLALIYERSIHEDIPWPYIAEFGDYSEPGLLENPPDEKARTAKEFQDRIVRRVKNKKSLSDLILIGEVYQWVYEFSRVDLHCPTAMQLAKFVGLSRQTFYRLYPNARKKIAKAYSILFGDHELVDPYGRDAVLKQNIKAKTKKSNFSSIQRDYAPSGNLRILRRRKPFR